MKFSLKFDPERPSLSHQLDLNQLNEGQHTINLGHHSLIFTLSLDYWNFGEPEEISSEPLNWSDLQNLHDVIIKLLDENTEILTKYEKIHNAQFGDTDVKSEAYLTVNRGIRQSKPQMKSWTRHLNTECEVMPDVDPIFEDTLNKENGFVEEDLEKQVQHINSLFYIKTAKVEELEKK